MISLGTGNSTCFPVMVSSELCKKRMINQDFPTVGRILSVRKREKTWPIYGELYPQPPAPATVLLETEGGILVQGTNFGVSQSRRILHCPLLSNTCCNLEPSPATLRVPSGEQLPCPSSPCKQQETRSTLTWWLTKSCQGQDMDCHLLEQHLATAWTCSYRHKECELCDVGLCPAQGNLVVPPPKVYKISTDKVIKLTAKLPDTKRNYQYNPCRIYIFCKTW